MLDELCDGKCLSHHLDGQGGWDDFGCRKYNSSSDYTTCLCDHLTNFGVLLVQATHFRFTFSWEERFGLRGTAAHLKVLVTVVTTVVAVHNVVVKAKQRYQQRAFKAQEIKMNSCQANVLLLCSLVFLQISETHLLQNKHNVEYSAFM